MNPSDYEVKGQGHGKTQYGFKKSPVQQMRLSSEGMSVNGLLLKAIYN